MPAHPPVLQVTPAAERRLRALLMQRGRGVDPLIRVQLKGGGCSGLAYRLTLEVSSRDDDRVFRERGLRFLFDPKSLLYSVGMVLDFDDDELHGGFQFQHPGAEAACDCSTQF